SCTRGVRLRGSASASASTAGTRAASAPELWDRSRSWFTTGFSRGKDGLVEMKVQLASQHHLAGEKTTGDLQPGGRGHGRVGRVKDGAHRGRVVEHHRRGPGDPDAEPGGR